MSCAVRDLVGMGLLEFSWLDDAICDEATDHKIILLGSADKE